MGGADIGPKKLNGDAEPQEADFEIVE